MRTVSYKCDRCGKPMTGRSAIKIAATLQRGVEPVEKSTHDFCQKCFVKVKAAFSQSMLDVGGRTIERPAVEPVEEAPAVQEKPAPRAKLVGRPVKDGKSVRFTVETPVVKKEPVKEEPVKEEPVKEEPVKEEPVKEAWDGKIIMGPLSKAEHAEILRLHVEEGLDADKVAERLHRLPKGVKRCINSAAKSGELDRLKAAFEGNRPVPEAVEDADEGWVGTGASNSGIVRDAYTAPPQTEVVEGKRYNVGGILALAKAGWNAKLIADERHYDEDVVRLLLEKYNG